MSANAEDYRLLRAAMLHGLQHGLVALIVDADDKDTVLPPHLKGLQRIDYGLSTAIPIPDLRVDAAGVFGTLSFGREPYVTFVPWHAVHNLLAEAPEISIEELDAIASRPISAVVALTASRPKTKLRALTEADVFEENTPELSREFVPLRLIK